jgi:hypothetical protein
MSLRNCLFAAASLVLIAGCVPRQAPPPPVSTPPPAPAPAPAPLPPPPPVAWQDAEASAGDWTYRDAGGRATAAFVSTNAPSVTLMCLESRSILIAVQTPAPASSIVVRTSFGERQLPASQDHFRVSATLAAADPLLDEIAFSRGRFLVQAAGAAPTILPAWPEVARVVEDCRG